MMSLRCLLKHVSYKAVVLESDKLSGGRHEVGRYSMFPLTSMQNRKIISGKLYFTFGTILIGLVLLGLFKVYGYENTWKLWQIETLVPPFSDLRLIPGSAATFRRGLDPTIDNPGDPYHRIFNYPRIWYLLFYTNINQDDVIWLGVFIFALFYIGLISFPGKLNWLGVVLMLLITFSPAAMLLYERANVDLLIFFICAMAVLVIDYSSLGAALILLLGALLKIFPIFGLSIFLVKDKKLFWRYVFLVVASFGMYAWLSFSNIQASWTLTMRGKEISYGINVIFYRYYDTFSMALYNLLPTLVTEKLLQVLPYLLGLTVLIAATLFGLKSPPPDNSKDTRNLTAFRMGSFIYIGTFLLGNNWDYRLAFLLFTVPQLADWARPKRKRFRSGTITTIALTAISCWHFILAYWFSLGFPDSEIAIIIDEIANWGLFALLTYFSVVSLPVWVKEMIKVLFKGFRLPTHRLFTFL